MAGKYPTPYIALFFILAFVGVVPKCEAQNKRPFTVADDIGLKHFVGKDSQQAMRFSPEGSILAVLTERGRLDLNCVEDSLWFYRTSDMEDFLKRPNTSDPPSPVWVVSRTGKEGPIMSDWRWLPDSSGVAFLEGGGGFYDDRRLMLADLRKKTVMPLTPEGQWIREFDVRDAENYVYTAVSLAENKTRQPEPQPSAIVATGRTIYELLFPDISWVAGRRRLSHAYLRAVIAGKPFNVLHDGAPLAPDGQLALSPDGQSLVTTLLVPQVPPSWETSYLPSYQSSPYRIRAGHPVSQYVQIHLETGAVQPLTDAPVSESAGWLSGDTARPSWSSDGNEVLLPDTFLKSKEENVATRPCVAIVDVHSHAQACIEMLRGQTETGYEDGYHFVLNVWFSGPGKHQVTISFETPPISYNSLEANEYQLRTDGTWQMVRQTKGDPFAQHDGIEVAIKEGVNDPPMLFATDKGISKVIFDPNPQLKIIGLTEATIYTWKDKQGQEWKGELFKPAGYEAGRRYPLLIGTHSFSESDFIPTPGVWPIRSFAAAGIAVLQVRENCPVVTLGEGRCVASGYEAAAKQLVSDGLADPENIGIVGFSRTCFYVMETLTTTSLHMKAASITDGVMFDYWQYVLWPEHLAGEYNSVMAATPFGEGLQQWLKRSPGFNLDKINTPLLVVGAGPASLLFMWEPYSALHYLHKPVELVMLNTDEHALTNPAVGMASYIDSMDWFRFWLQGYEDPDPAKQEQYARWRELRAMQAGRTGKN